MIPVNCQCANNINGMCYGDVNDSIIADVQSGRFTWDNDGQASIPTCPGKIPLGEAPFEGVPQGEKIVPPGV